MPIDLGVYGSIHLLTESPTKKFQDRTLELLRIYRKPSKLRLPMVGLRRSYSSGGLGTSIDTSATAPGAIRNELAVYSKEPARYRQTFFILATR